MGKVIYFDVEKVKTETEPEDAELLGLFDGRNESDRMLLMMGDGAIGILPKAVVWAKARAIQLEREQQDREIAREQEAARSRARSYSRRREAGEIRTQKRRDDKRRRAASGGLWAAAAACGAGILDHAGNPGGWLMLLGLLMMGTGAWYLWKGAGSCRR